jgi:hypothetical protein
MEACQASQKEECKTMAKLTPQEFQQKHATRLKASIPDMKAGVGRVTVAPGQQAAAQQNKMLNNLQESVTSGKWARRVASVSLEEWKSKMIDKGAARIGQGIDAAAPKVIDFASQFLPFLDTVQQKVKNMPSMTLEDNIQRMVTQVTETAKFRRQ